MDVTLFVWFVLICSLVTALVVQALKVMMKDASSNLLAAVVSIIVAVGVAVFYAIFTKTVVDVTFIAMTVLLCIASWLCAMLGYDKVIQTIEQIISARK